MANENSEIKLGHKILDHLPRGEDGDLLSEAIRDRIAELLASERQACADIVLSLGGGLGNEKEIAKAILLRGEAPTPEARPQYSRPR